MTIDTETAADFALSAIARARRAVTAEQRSAPALVVERAPLASLHSLAESWAALAAHAVERNVFLEPAFALGAAPVLGADVEVFLVWSQATPRQLVGLFPCRIERHRYGLPLPVLSSWSHPYAPFGTPLVDRDIAASAISAWLDHLAGNRRLPGVLLMPYLNDDGAFASLFDPILARRGTPTTAFDRHQRALLAPDGHRAGYLDRAITRKHRRELARKCRRLAEIGPVAFVSATTPEAVTAAVDDFFRIEASGWKGRVGTAAAIHPDIRRFMAEATLALVAQGQAIIRLLKVGDDTIAAAIALRSGADAWGWKIAYDESYARYSPGVEIIVRLTEDLLSDEGVDTVDSLATANHPMINNIWRERRTMSDRLIAIRRSAVPFPWLCRLESIRRQSYRTAKALRDRLRDRHRPDNGLTRAGATAGE